MKTFSDLLQEDHAGKNLHLEHLEDEIINNCVAGGRAAINFLQSLRDMLAGSARSSINMTVKWDGAPAIFAGIDPSDGKFFVAKKSVFNVGSPKPRGSAPRSLQSKKPARKFNCRIEKCN